MAKILLIDDEENARVLTAQFLELAGHQVVTAENGIQGHERALESAFDLVITDIIMPEKEGFETIKDQEGTTRLTHPRHFRGRGHPKR